MAKKDKQGGALKPRAGKRASPHLSEEEHALWQHAARDLKPLKVKKERTPAHGGETPTAARPQALAPVRAEPAPRTRGREPAAKPQAAKIPAAPPLADLERRKTRAIGTGRIDIEARIDLHGLHQAEAHAALNRFLTRAHADGRRWVLVITGKGAPLDRERAADDVGYANVERGVLRRNVPIWLAEPGLRAIVVGYATAAIRHGGEGALYVQLRRRERAGGAD
jgi:DNA-nicking Smr family endonuclease